MDMSPDHMCPSPQDVLAAGAERHMLRATRSIAEPPSGFSSVESVLRWAQSDREVPRIEPRRSAVPAEWLQALLGELGAVVRGPGFLSVVAPLP